MVLCSQCAEIDFGTLIERACTKTEVEAPDASSRRNRVLIKYLSFANLREAAIQGCDLCSLIHHGVLATTSTKDSREHLADDTPLVVFLMFNRCHPDLVQVTAQCRSLLVEYPIWCGVRRMACFDSCDRSQRKIRLSEALGLGSATLVLLEG
jgi:hypothetical protein